jgi:tetratricopeptide (TPR) repeat protein
MMLGDHAAAVDAWREATRRDTMAAYAFLNNEAYGSALRHLGRFAEAESVFRLMLGASTERAGRGHRSLAQMAAFRGKYDSAAWHFRESLRLSLRTAGPVSVMRTHLFLATVAERRGERAEARRELDRAYETFRDSYIDPNFLTLLGKALARAGEVRRAQEVLDSVARRHNPRAATDRATLAMLRGEVTLARGDRKEAVDEAAGAYAADSMAHILETLAHVLAASGDLDAAAARYRQLIDRNDQAHEAQEHWVQAHYELARIHEARGDTAEAARWYTALLDLWKDADPDLPLLGEVRARLRRLRPAVAPARSTT